MVMDVKLTGSELTRAILSYGEKQVWCAVDDDSDEEAMIDLYGNDFTAYIVSFNQGQFYSDSGTTWNFAVPIRIVALKQEIVELT